MDTKAVLNDCENDIEITISLDRIKKQITITRKVGDGPVEHFSKSGWDDTYWSEEQYEEQKTGRYRMKISYCEGITNENPCLDVR